MSEELIYVHGKEPGVNSQVKKSKRFSMIRQAAELV